jgi:hypothetical protein
MSGLALEGRAVLEGEGQEAIRMDFNMSGSRLC